MLKNEKLKTQNKELEKKLADLSNQITSSNNNNSLINNNNINNNNSTKKELQIQNLNEKSTNPLEEALPEMKKKMKISENKIVEMRNKNQVLKDENTKLIVIIKREIGENNDIEKVLKINEKSNWKGRAELIEFLKSKIKNMENQISVTSKKKFKRF